MLRLQHVLSRARMVDLHKVRIAACQPGKFAPIEVFKEITASAAKYFLVR